MDVYQHEVSNKFGIPLSNLDYGYIEKCKDAKELEKIVKCLRSGVEGRFPELEKKAEDRLATIDPNSKVLRKAEHVVTHSMMAKEERDGILDDMESWSSQMKSVETKLKTVEPLSSAKNDLPPVRGSGMTIATEQVTCESKQSGSSTKNKKVKPREYREWDKFDIDAELAKVDDTNEEKETNEKKKVPTKPSVPEKVDSNVMTPEEQLLTANREKDKGNEAFRAGDYAEALVYYNRSLSLMPSVAAQNNRAQTYIKLQRWDDAIVDCNNVLKAEPGNVKALLRRGVAHQGKKNLINAKNDLQQVVELEPTNKQAKDVLAKVEQSLENQKKKGRRMIIEEVDGSDSDEIIDMKQENGVSGPKIEVLESEISSNQILEAETLSSADTCTFSNQTSNVESLNSNKGSKTFMVNGHEEVSDKNKQNISEVANNGTHTSNRIPNVQTHSSMSEVVKDEPKSEQPLLDQKDDSESENVKSLLDNLMPSPLSTELSPHCSPNTENGNEESSKNIPVASAEADTEGKLESSPSTADSSPGQPTPPPPLPPDVVLLKIAGNDLFKVGQYGEALWKYTQAIDKLQSVRDMHRENMSILYSNRAACRSKTGDCEGCVRDCNAALDLTPTAVKPMLRRAAAYEQMEKYRKAYVEYRQVLFQDSSILSANQGINRCSNMLLQLDGKSWRDKLPQKPVVSSSPSCSQTLSDVPSASTPNLCIETSEEDLDYMREEKFEKYKTEGNTLVAKGHYQEAIDCYTTCLQLCPDRAVPYTNRALCYLKQKKPVRVVDDCTAALQIEENNVKALFRRSQAYKMLERPRESADDLRKLLTIDASNSLAQKELRVAEHAIRQRETQEKRAAVAQKTAAAQAQRARQRLHIQEVEASSSEDEECSTKCKAHPGSDHVPKVQGEGNGSHHSSSPVFKHGSHVVPEKSHSVTHHSNVIKSPNKPSTQAVKTEESSSSKSKLPSASVQKPAKSCIVETAMERDLSQSSGDVSSSEKKEQVGHQVPKLTKATPFEFIQAWTSLKSTKTPQAYATLMEQLDPEELPKVVSNKLDGDMLHMIICCTELLVDKGDASKAFAYLQNLTTVPRFQMATMFMSSKEKQDLERVIGKLLMVAKCPQLQKDLHGLKKAYSL